MPHIPPPLVQLPPRWQRADDFWHLVLDRETVAYLYPEVSPWAERWGQQQAYVIWLNPDYWSRETVELWRDAEILLLETAQEMVLDLWTSEGRPPVLKGPPPP